MLDGPAIAAWLEDRCLALAESKVQTLGESNFRRFTEWKKGGTAGIETVDKVLLHLDIEPWELPASIYPQFGSDESEKTHAYCEHCSSEVPINPNESGELCLWCDGATREFRAPRNKAKAGDRRRLKQGKINQEQLRLLHRIHIEEGKSINSLAQALFKQFGYASRGSCATSISNGFKRLGLKARDRIEATVAVSTKHGLAPKHGPRPGYGVYRRKVLNREPYQPRCEEIVKQGSRKGEQCEHSAMKGSEYCQSHDPAFDEDRRAHLERMRSQRAIDRVPLAPLTAWLAGRREELGTWHEVACEVNRSTSLVHAYGNGVSPSTKKPLGSIGRKTVEKLLEEAGVEFDLVYERELVAA